MQYLLLIYSNEAEAPHPETPEDFAAYMQPWTDYTDNLKAAKVYVGGEALELSTTATTITSVGSSKPVFTDGPFAETREQLGGYYLLDCKDLDEALAWGAKCPAVEYGKIEVRAIMDVG